MFDKINVAQIYCYVSEVDGDNLRGFAQQFLGKDCKIHLDNAQTFHGETRGRHLRIESFVLPHSQLPWQHEISLTCSRSARPTDEWLAVQFARTCARNLRAISWCDTPHEINATVGNPWRLRFDARSNPPLTQLVRTFDRDVDWVEEVGIRTISLGEFPLFGTELPYE